MKTSKERAFDDRENVWLRVRPIEGTWVSVSRVDEGLREAGGWQVRERYMPPDFVVIIGEPK